MSISLVRVLDVAVAWLSRNLGHFWFAFIPCVLFAATKSSAASPPLAFPNCELLSRGPGVALQDQEILLHTFLSDFLGELRSDRMEKLEKYFHPRAKKTSELGEKLRILLKNRYDLPWQFSIYRVWRLSVPNASKAIFDSCPENEGAALIGQFGYEKQFMVMIQIMGQNELGRILIAAAADRGKMYATALRLQQWTQQGFDAEVWASRAEAAAQAQDPVQTALAFDVAQKLLSGEDLIVYPRQRQLQKQRDTALTQDDLVNKINDLLKTKSVVYVGTMLGRDGTGLMLRERVESQEPLASLQMRCLAQGTVLKENGWIAKTSGGLRCNYIFPGMNPAEDSPLGGIYLNHEDLTNSQKK